MGSWNDAIPFHLHLMSQSMDSGSVKSMSENAMKLRALARTSCSSCRPPKALMSSGVATFGKIGPMKGTAPRHTAPAKVSSGKFAAMSARIVAV